MRYILSFRIFEQLVLALKNRDCPKNFQATGGGRPPPRLVRLYDYGACTLV